MCATRVTVTPPLLCERQATPHGCHDLANSATVPPVVDLGKKRGRLGDGAVWIGSVRAPGGEVRLAAKRGTGTDATGPRRSSSIASSLSGSASVPVAREHHLRGWRACAIV